MFTKCLNRLGQEERAVAFARHSLGDLTRTHYCGELRPEHVGQTVTLMGWAATRRDLGGVIFIDLRDRYGLTQVSVSKEDVADIHAVATSLRPEFSVQVEGVVRERPGDAIAATPRPPRG